MPSSESFSKFIFAFLFAALPLAIIPNWGNSYTEPKMTVLFALAIFCLFSLLRRRGDSDSIAVFPPTLALAGVVIFQLLFIRHGGNTGLLLQSLALSMSALAIGLYVCNTDLSLSFLAKAMILPTAVVLIGALAMILFRTPLFSGYSPFGSTVGLKNSLSVYLAQIVPFLLYLGVAARYKSNKSSLIGKGMAALLLSLLFWVVSSSRTRSSWWMLIIYGVALVVMALKAKNQKGKAILLFFLATLLAGILLLRLIPNKLSWKTESPYIDSLTSLASFEKSSGRDQLWRVGLHIVKTHPWTGIGTGNYPSTWKAHIKGTDVDPKSFGFLREDLPLFNDYLQAAVENGIFPGLLFFLVMAGFPLFYCLKCLSGDAGEDRSAEWVMALVCLATAGDAFFDAPFNRPETLLNFHVALALVAKSSTPPALVLSRSNKKAYGPLLGAMALFLAVVLVLMSVGLTSRKIWTKRHDPKFLKAALTFWPWDWQWHYTHSYAFLVAGDIPTAQRLVEKRMRAWPNDPESYLMKAKWHEANNQFPEAIEAFRRGVLRVENGACYFRGYGAYLQMAHRSDFPKNVPKLTEQDLSSCQPKP